MTVSILVSREDACVAFSFEVSTLSVRFGWFKVVVYMFCVVFLSASITILRILVSSVCFFVSAWCRGIISNYLLEKCNIYLLMMPSYTSFIILFDTFYNYNSVQFLSTLSIKRLSIFLFLVPLSEQTVIKYLCSVNNLSSNVPFNLTLFLYKIQFITNANVDLSPKHNIDSCSDMHFKRVEGVLPCWICDIFFFGYYWSSNGQDPQKAIVATNYILFFGSQS